MNETKRVDAAGGEAKFKNIRVLVPALPSFAEIGGSRFNISRAGIFLFLYFLPFVRTLKDRTRNPFGSHDAAFVTSSDDEAMVIFSDLTFTYQRMRKYHPAYTVQGGTDWLPRMSKKPKITTPNSR